MPAFSCLEIEESLGISYVWLNRPDVRNAFNPTVIAELTEYFTNLSGVEPLRCVVLGGRGTHFCAGADLNWMREMAEYSLDENLADARALAAMLGAIDACPWRLIGRVQGGAFGGALGLMSCCDMVIATDDCKFAFSEVRLGISPATIAPFVLARIGAGHARDLLLSGRRFDAAHAQRVGLVHQIVAPDQLDAAVESALKDARACGPRAVMHTKALISTLHATTTDEVADFTARLIAELRAAPEGKEGLSAFLEKRKPEWVE